MDFQRAFEAYVMIGPLLRFFIGNPLFSIEQDILESGPSEFSRFTSPPKKSPTNFPPGIIKSADSAKVF